MDDRGDRKPRVPARGLQHVPFMVQPRPGFQNARKAGPAENSASLFSHRRQRASSYWLKGLGEDERHEIGRDLLRAQWRWPVGMPLRRPMGKGLWEVRTDLPGNRTSRVLICLYQDRLVALHGFTKKTRATPEDDLALARNRQKELRQ
jgi:phage-related protein